MVREKINFCLVGEPTNPNKLGEMIKIGRRGSLTGNLKIFGSQGHVAYPQRANNPSTTIVKILKEIKSPHKYREFEVDYKKFYHDLENKQEELKFSDLELIFRDFKSLFEKRGFIINWKDLEKQSLDETINALAMASPFSLEEKQVLLEAKNLDMRKDKIAEILSTYSYDVFNNTTIQ